MDHDHTGVQFLRQIEFVLCALAVAGIGVGLAQVTAQGGALRFERGEGGRLGRVETPDGTTLVYQYDAEGRLVGERNLSDGSGNRYGYDQGTLVAAVAIGGQGQSISYGADGAVTVSAPAGMLVVDRRATWCSLW
jgi:YD repeat-containing protein